MRARQNGNQGQNRWIVPVLLTALAVCMSGCSGGRETEKEKQPAEASYEAGSEADLQISDTGTEESSQPEDENVRSKTQAAEALCMVKAQLGWEPGQKTRLEDIQALLDEAKLGYTGYFNQTQERLDLELEDGTKLLFLEVSNDTGENRRFELILAGDGTFNKDAFQEDYLHHYDVIIDELYYPNMSERLLEENDLYGWNLTDLQIARNEPFARRGRIFQDSFLRAVFSVKSWYQPRYTAEEFEQKAEPLSETEQANLALILKVEKEWKTEYGSGSQSLRQDRLLLSGSRLDLDGDGTKEQIRYEITDDPENNGGEYCLEISGQHGVQKVSGTGEALYRHLSVIDWNENGCLLLAGGNGPSDDPWNDYYLYRSYEPLLVGSLPGYFQGMDEAGVIYVSAQRDFFQSHIPQIAYALDSAYMTLKELDQTFYEYGNEAQAKQAMQLYADQSYEKAGILLQAGDVVVIEGSNYKDSVRIQKKATGETGWLKCRMPYYCTLPDGREVESYELFEGLPFFG